VCSDINESSPNLQAELTTHSQNGNPCSSSRTGQSQQLSFRRSVLQAAAVGNALFETVARLCISAARPVGVRKSLPRTLTDPARNRVNSSQNESGTVRASADVTVVTKFTRKPYGTARSPVSQTRHVDQPDAFCPRDVACRITGGQWTEVSSQCVWTSPVSPKNASEKASRFNSEQPAITL
jgi:hypothetical protein